MLRELNELKEQHEQNPQPPGSPSPYDILRRKYLSALAQTTGRAASVYATPWLESRIIPNAEALTVNRGDIQGFMEAVSNVKERELDLIVTSPGGSAEAAEAIMGYLRTRFDNIRFIVPVSAMSAATMMALACDEIVMADHSHLGPIDPQFTIGTPEGPRSAPAQAIVDQFEMAKQECRDPQNIGAWLPLLRSFLPGLLAQCKHQRQMAEEFAQRSLAQYMFAGRSDSLDRAKKAAEWFADFSEFKSHGRRVSREDAEAQGLVVTRLEDDHGLQDLVLSVHHAVRHTFNGGTGVTKLIENHHGRAYIEVMQQAAIQLVPANAPQPAQPSGPPPGNRAERRRQQRGHRR
jgi:hypothetical protein